MKPWKWPRPGRMRKRFLAWCSAWESSTRINGDARMRETDVGSQSDDTIKLKFRKGFRAAVRAANVCTEAAEVSDDRRTKGSLGIFTLSLGSIRPGDLVSGKRRYAGGGSRLSVIDRKGRSG